MLANRPIVPGYLRQWLLMTLTAMPLLCATHSIAQRPLNTFGEQTEPTQQESFSSISSPTEFVENEFAETEFSEYDAWSSEAAEFDRWEPLVDAERVTWDSPRLKPFDWVRHFGFRHSSTHGRFIDRGIPLEGTSWLNRPYHIDWFTGTLIGDDLIPGNVAQDNELFGGFRIGWDFDYYWGLEARFGFSRPNAELANPLPAPDNISYFVSDVDIVYYPWGDTKIRPYLLGGVGMTRLRFRDQNATSIRNTLVTIPFGGGIQFSQSPRILWRLEVLDNLAIGGDGIDTLNNISLTAGMEFRLGGRRASYWPWRASRSPW